MTSGRDRLYERVPGDRRGVANVIMNQFAGAGVDPDAVDPEELAKLVDARDRIPRAQFDEAISGRGPGLLGGALPRRDLDQRRRRARPGHRGDSRREPGQVDAYRGGKDGLLGFFVGQVMQATQGKANPKVVSERLREKLS